jgi:hypothetical protein
MLAIVRLDRIRKATRSDRDFTQCTTRWAFSTAIVEKRQGWPNHKDLANKRAGIAVVDAGKKKKKQTTTYSVQRRVLGEWQALTRRILDIGRPW